VQCAHGATAGQIDAQTLFYLRSRGLDIETASRMLVQAFAREIVDTVKPETLRNYLESLFDRSIVVKSLPVALQ
jgi:Fe-S cluster assembly protein SufD